MSYELRFIAASVEPGQQIFGSLVSPRWVFGCAKTCVPRYVSNGTQTQRLAAPPTSDSALSAILRIDNVKARVTYGIDMCDDVARPKA